MTIAEIHGKMPLNYSEDILTADVFAAFRYLPADIGIAGFLRSIDGIADILPEPDEETVCEFHFWPLGTFLNRKPDLLLELRIGGRVFHIVVEAKYLSGPSDIEDTDIEHEGELLTIGNQLGDEYRDLQQGQYIVYKRGQRSEQYALASNAEDRLLLYLTAHVFRPQDELDRCIDYCPEIAGRLFWASWYDVYGYLDSVRETEHRFPNDRILDDALTLLHGKQFSLFQGITQPPEVVVEDRDGLFWRWFADPPEIELSRNVGSFWHWFSGPSQFGAEEAQRFTWRE
jgi:hypothetical protein